MTETTTPPVATRATTAPFCADWEEAVRRAAGMLIELHAATPGYVEACVQSLRINGPYIVLAPGLALAHARPEQGATGVAVTLLKLDQPVAFGHPANDPVDLVFAFSTPDPDAHLEMLQVLARALSGGLANRLREATTDELNALLQQATADD